MVLNNYFYVAHDNFYDRYEITHSGCFDLYRIFLSRRTEWEHVLKHIETRYLKDILTDGNQIFFMIKNEIISFDPTNHKLSPTIEFPDGMQFWMSVLMKNKIFLLAFEQMYIYDIVQQSWCKGSLTKLLEPHADVMIDRWIVVISGYLRKNCSFNTFVYDTFSQQWTQVKMDFKVGSHIISVGRNDLNYDENCRMTVIHIKHIITEFTWIMLKPYILLQQLVDENRATPSIATKKPNIDESDMSTDANTKANTNVVVQKLFTNIPLEIFRYILMYL